jgi:hypothetical protein
MKKILIDITNVHESDKNALVEKIHSFELSCFKRDKREHHMLRTYYEVNATEDVVKDLCDYLADECWSWVIWNKPSKVKEEVVNIHHNGEVKRLKSVNTDEVELEVLECSCGYHMGIDSSFLEGVGDFKTICPSCSREIDTEVDIPETVEDIKKMVDANQESEKVTVDKGCLNQLLSYVWDEEESSCEEYVKDGGHEDDHIFNVIKFLREQVGD